MIFLRDIIKFLDEKSLGSIEVTIRLDYYSEGLKPFDINKVPEYLNKAYTTKKPVTRRLNKNTIVIFRKFTRYAGKRKLPKEDLSSTL